MPSPPDLLDSNIFVHLIRGDATGQLLKREYDLLLTEPPPAFCVVTQGELRSLTYQFNWGEDKKEQVGFLLNYFNAVPLETAGVFEAYAAIDYYSKRMGIKMGKNDLWIAAVASVSKFRLLTTDADFDHLDPTFLTRVRIHYTI